MRIVAQLFRNTCSMATNLLVVVSIGSAAEPNGIGIDVHDCVVRFAEEVEVPALATGRIAEVFVSSNQSVEASTPLVRLDDRSLLIRRRSNQLRLELARQAALNEIELKYAETALAEAQQELDSNRSIQNDFSGAVAMTQLRRLRLAVQRGELEVERAKKRRVEAETAVELAEAELSVVDDQLRSLHVESPLAGILLETSKSVGEWVQTGDTVVTIARIDRIHIHALLDSTTIAPHRCTGLPVSVHWVDLGSGQENSLRGRVLSVDPNVMPGGRYRVHAEIVNECEQSSTAVATATAWKLRPGAEVKMKIYAAAEIAIRPSRMNRPN